MNGQEHKIIVLQLNEMALERAHKYFQSRAGPSEPLYFNKLPGRPLPNLHNNAGRCRASSRKIHAPGFAAYQGAPGQ